MSSRSFAIRSLVALALLCSGPIPAFSQQSPRDVLEQFCELDAQGKQLSVEGWNEIARLFVTPTSPKRDRVIVVKDFVVSRPAMDKNKAGFYVEYVQLGRIDSSLAKLSRLPPIKVRANFELVSSDNTINNGAIRTAGRNQWRIEGTPAEPHLTVDSAIRV